MQPLPSFAQIQHVKQLLETGLFGPMIIVRLTGVPLRDVFRIAKSLLPSILVTPDGMVLDGQHRLAATR
ncbi:MAG TPA: hypothetical protein DEB39_08755 [Planctomycetaceae bacterium]|nr:hypothetical protein [Planctomycetaceae bacterium]